MDTKQQSNQPKNPMEKPSGNSFPHFSVNEWIALAGVLILAVSFFWELGYWHAFRISLEEIPLSLESTIVALMPSLVFPVTMALGYGFAGAFLAKDKNDLRDSGMPNWVKKLGTESINGLMIAMVLVYFFSVLLRAYELGEIGIGTLWVIFVLFTMHIIINVYKSKSAFIFFLLFISSSYVFIEGWSAAVESIKNPRLVQLYVANGSAEKKEDLVILRSNNDFVFAYNPKKKKVKVMPWRKVSLIAYDSTPDDGAIEIPPFLLFKDEDRK